MRTLLIDPFVDRFEGADLPSPALAQLCGALRARGLEVEVIDMRLGDRIGPELIKSAGLVGITSMTFGFPEALRIARMVREAGGPPVVMGGPHPSMLGAKLLQDFPEIDCIIRGEGDEALPNLATNGNRSGISGLIYREGCDIRENPVKPIGNLDEVPFADYEPFREKSYTKFPRECYISTSRGCPFHCVFCGAHHIMGRPFRYRSASNVIGEVESLKRDLGVQTIRILDENFTNDRDRATEILDALRAFELEVTLVSGIRVSTTDPELLDNLYAAGVRKVSFGIESTDPEVLRLTRKGLNLDKARVLIDRAKSLGMHVRGFFIVGLPGDTLEKSRKSIDDAVDMGFDSIGVNLATPLPGTELWNFVEQHGRFLVSPLKHMYENTFTPEFGKATFETPEFTETERLQAYRHAIAVRNRLDGTTSYIFRTFFRKLFRGEMTLKNMREGFSLAWTYFRTGYYP